MTRLFIILLVLFRFVSSAQPINEKDSFYYMIAEVKGDLNNDYLIDKVMVGQDTLNDKAPYRLQVFLPNLIIPSN